MSNAAPLFFSTPAASRLNSALSALVASLGTESSHALHVLAKAQVRYVQTYGVKVPVVCQCLNDWPNDIGVDNKSAESAVICQLNYRSWLGQRQLLAGFARQADGSSEKLDQTQLKQLMKTVDQKHSELN